MATEVKASHILVKTKEHKEMFIMSVGSKRRGTWIFWQRRDGKRI